MEENKNNRQQKEVMVMNDNNNESISDSVDLLDFDDKK